MAALVNPHLGTATEGGWAMGFSWGFVGPAFSSDPPLVIAPEQSDAFNAGVLAGQETAISGLTIDPPCVSLEQEVSPAAEEFMEGVHLFEGLGLLKALVTTHFAHAAVDGLVGLFLLLIPGPMPLNPATVFGDLAANVRRALNELGLARSSLFLAAGFDDAAAGCELLFTPIFTRIDDARAAVEALGRAHWFIARWDADAPLSGGGFEVIESNEG